MRWRAKAPQYAAASGPSAANRIEQPILLGSRWSGTPNAALIALNERQYQQQSVAALAIAYIDLGFTCGRCMHAFVHQITHPVPYIAVQLPLPTDRYRRPRPIQTRQACTVSALASHTAGHTMAMSNLATLLSSSSICRYLSGTMCMHVQVHRWFGLSQAYFNLTVI